jgi:hypothetical protein
MNVVAGRGTTLPPGSLLSYLGETLGGQKHVRHRLLPCDEIPFRVFEHRQKGQLLHVTAFLFGKLQATGFHRDLCLQSRSLLVQLESYREILEVFAGHCDSMIASITLCECPVACGESASREV